MRRPRTSINYKGETKMIRNEWDQADSDNKDAKLELLNEFAKFMQTLPKPIYDFDRSDGHSEARRKAGWLR